jgi:hypothetical protein
MIKLSLLLKLEILRCRMMVTLHAFSCMCVGLIIPCLRLLDMYNPKVTPLAVYRSVIPSSEQQGIQEQTEP